MAEGAQWAQPVLRWLSHWEFRMKIALIVIGLVAAGLGGLWIVQGIGLVRLKPVLCVANCAPVQGPSLTWALIGALVLLLGLFLLSKGVKRR